MSIFKGAGVAIVTPMKENEERKKKIKKEIKKKDLLHLYC